MSKRSKFDIYCDVLALICREGGRLGEASPTRVASRANLSYVRFQKILDHFIKLDMVRRTDEGILITKKGLNCLSQLRRTNQMLRLLGLA